MEPFIFIFYCRYRLTGCGSQASRQLDISSAYEKCVGHVQKKIGNAIITLRKNPPIEIIKIVVKKVVPARKATKRCPTVKIFLP